MELHLAYTDLRKLATMFRKDGVALLDCRQGDNKNLQIDVRADLAKLVSMVASITKSAPVTVHVWLSLQVEDPDTIAVTLDGLDLDKKELPMLMRTFVGNDRARKELFAALPDKSWLESDAETQIIRIQLPKLLQECKSKLSVAVKDCAVTTEGLRIVGDLQPLP